MALNEDLKRKLMAYGSNRGISAPEDFMGGPNMEGPNMGESAAELVIKLRNSPDFDLVKIIKMLVEETGIDDMEEPVMEEPMAEMPIKM